MAKIYVASSWRNQHQPQVVSFLREQGHEVYDFRHPAGKTGFQWSQIDEDWRNWSTDQYRAALEHPIAQAGFKSDFDAMQWADVCVLVLPLWTLCTFGGRMDERSRKKSNSLSNLGRRAGIDV